MVIVVFLMMVSELYHNLEDLIVVNSSDCNIAFEMAVLSHSWYFYLLLTFLPITCNYSNSLVVFYFFFLHFILEMIFPPSIKVFKLLIYCPMCAVLAIREFVFLPWSEPENESDSSNSRC